MPPDESKQGPGFTIVDRRGSAAEQEPAAPPPPLPKVDFAGLALSLATSALFHLGLVPDPQTGQPGTKNLALARHSIDTLELLFFHNDIDSEEKIQLARYYAETWANVERGEKLVNEALKKDPKNPELLKLKAKLVKGNTGKKKSGGGGGIQIIKGKGR